MKRIVMLLAVALLAPWTVDAQYVSVSGTVVDSLSGLPVERVMVYLTDRTSVQTRNDGTFELRRVPAEETLVMFRRIGYSPRALRLDLERFRGRAVDLGEIKLHSAPVGMDQITIESRLVNRNPRLNDYFRRMKQGRGDYITRQDIWNKNPMTTSEMLRWVPGITVNCAYLTACTPSTMRKGSGVMTGELTCPMRVLLDGIPVALNVDEIPPAWVAGIEVYRSAAFTPLELMSSRGSTEQGSSQCGTVVIWTGGDEY